jgi:bifunctional UDP-N-acetylglucosamine pyrophosphorylase/glucosamine-1-phosphate N-acetyltransferase
MESPLPKVLHRVGGRTMVDRVVAVLYEAGVAEVVVVIGFGREAVEAELLARHPAARIAVQEEQLGTGHAVRCALPLLPDDAAEVAVFSGDTPLLTPAVVAALTNEHRRRDAALTLLTAELDDPAGYGRVLRDSAGLVDRIVEEKDAEPAEKVVKEINAGAYLFAAADLRSALEEVDDDNAQREYYLTDTVDILRRRGRPVAAVVVSDDPATVLGVNDTRQLLEAEMLLRERES